MRPALALAALPFLTACSTAWHKLPATVATPGQTVTAELWIRAEAGEQPVNFVTDTILFPIDAVFSLLAAFAALNSDQVDIEAGPGGTLLAMALPFVTATYDPEVDSLEEMQAGKELPYRRPAPVLIAVPAASWQAWRRGERSLADAVADAPGSRWLADRLRSGDAELTLLGGDGGRDTTPR